MKCVEDERKGSVHSSTEALINQSIAIVPTHPGQVRDEGVVLHGALPE